MKRTRLASVSLVLAVAFGSLSGAAVLATALSSPLGNRTDSPGQPGLPSSVTVAFWNIQWFPGHRPEATHGEEKRQINAVHADILRLNADVIGMEEVRDFAHAGLAIEPLPGFKVDVCGNFPPREGQNVGQQPAIASRLQPLSAWAEEWKAAGPILPPRGFAFAAYQVKPRQLLMIYDVHLKSNLGELGEDISMRQESMRQLQSHIEAMQTAYAKLGTITWIVGGDFNTSLDDKKFARESTLRDMINKGWGWIWRDIPASARITVPSERGFPPACFDHAFYRGANLRQASIVNTSWFSSDHRAVVATFDLPPADK